MELPIDDDKFNKLDDKEVKILNQNSIAEDKKKKITWVTEIS